MVWWWGDCLIGKGILDGGRIIPRDVSYKQLDDLRASSRIHGRSERALSQPAFIKHLPLFVKLFDGGCPRFASILESGLKYRSRPSPS